MKLEWSWALGDDLPRWLVLAACLLGAAAVVLLLGEVRRRGPVLSVLFGSGIAGLGLCLLAVLRPARVATRETLVLPRVVVLLDESRRLDLPAQAGTRRQLALKLLGTIERRSAEARLEWMGFGEAEPKRLPARPGDHGSTTTSDLEYAVRHLGQTAGERTQAVVVVSDGRLTRPAGTLGDPELRNALTVLGVPVHTVAVVERAPQDASVRAVHAAGASVAHQPFRLRVEVGCEGLDCARLPVTVREPRQGAAPAELGRGVAELGDGVGTVEFEITLERAGSRVVEVAIDAPPGDRIPDNDRRLLTFNVTRERVRLLHIAGRPTYDVRALRRWLKSDQSIDLVAFFILRSQHEEPPAEDEETALIRFPVDELFTEHLASFDAVLLQDIDAVTYRIAEHLPRLARYVEAGGGLIMVGGPAAFVGGGYAGTELGRVLPIELAEGARPFDLGEFVPRFTEVGRAAPALRALRQLVGEELPAQPGANLVGPARPRALVLWEHPRLTVGARPMPVLALGEAGEGRTIALGVDGTHLLAFSEAAARVGGRGYGALWDGLVGWLMRDPRYEAVRVELAGDCVAGQPATLRVIRFAGSDGSLDVALTRLGPEGREGTRQPVPDSVGGPVEVVLGSLEPGGYTAEVRAGQAPPTRFDFACERGGEAWSDSRPDPERLRRIARVTGGRAVGAGDVAELPLPKPTRITAERHVTPLLPAWVWTLAAAVMLGAHWVVRRRAGLL
jgi:uncharacterized membrane protein